MFYSVITGYPKSGHINYKMLITENRKGGNHEGCALGRLEGRAPFSNSVACKSSDSFFKAPTIEGF